MQDETGRQQGTAKPVADDKTKNKVQSAGEAVRDAASEGQKTAQQTASAVAGAAREQAEQGREQLAENANYLKDSARATAERQAEQRKGQAADYAADTAEDLRTAEQDVSNRWISAALSQGAEGFETLAESLRGKSVGEIVNQTQTFARQHPATFLTGCFAVGVAANRALRATKNQSSYTDRQGEFFSDRRESELHQPETTAYGETSPGYQAQRTETETERFGSTPYEQS